LPEFSVSSCNDGMLEEDGAARSSKGKLSAVLLQILLSLFAAFYLTTAILSLLPFSPLSGRSSSPIATFWDCFGFRQKWTLFGPELRDLNFHVTALVTFADGNVRVWEAPRMDKLSMWARFRKEKWRKWGNEVLPWPDYKHYWADSARYIARTCNNAGNPPMQVSLNLHWVKIPPPASGVSCARLPEHNLFSTFFVYRVTAADLK